jgi:3',5'-cyclic-nucleotide phosphodiesterase
MIRLQLAGCSGGIGGSGRQTTCYLLNDSVLIDAGTGLGTLSLEAMAGVDHVVLTHAHLDHIACLPLLVDSVAAMRNAPLQVWALPEVIAILRAHIFNDQIWPDFTVIPDAVHPFMQLKPLPTNGLILDGLHFTPLPALHGIPACGYRVSRGNATLAFSGDTGDCAAFWEAVNEDAAITAVIVECSYPSTMATMADLSMHMHAGRLAQRLSELPPEVTNVVIHRKPGFEDAIAAELSAALKGRDLRLPQPGEAYQFG